MEKHVKFMALELQMEPVTFWLLCRAFHIIMMQAASDSAQQRASWAKSGEAKEKF